MRVVLRQAIAGQAVAAMIAVSSLSSDQQAVDVQSLFTPSGLMGDGEYDRKYVEFSGADSSSPHSPPASVKVIYTVGPQRWAGQYWQNHADNWGDKPGHNYSARRLSRLSFWARGDTGTEVIEFKAGGIEHPAKKFRDSFVASTGRISLTRTWTRFSIDLTKSNLSSVIGAFAWIASADFNQERRIVFYLDDIVIE